MQQATAFRPAGAGTAPAGESAARPEIDPAPAFLGNRRAEEHDGGGCVAEPVHDGGDEHAAEGVGDHDDSPGRAAVRVLHHGADRVVETDRARVSRPRAAPGQVHGNGRAGNERDDALPQPRAQLDAVDQHEPDVLSRCICIHGGLSAHSTRAGSLTSGERVVVKITEAEGAECGMFHRPHGFGRRHRAAYAKAVQEALIDA